MLSGSAEKNNNKRGSINKYRDTYNYYFVFQEFLQLEQDKLHGMALVPDIGDIDIVYLATTCLWYIHVQMYEML